MPTIKSRIASRLVLAVILFSSLVTLVTTSIQIYFDYRQEIGEITESLALIRTSYLKSIAGSVWMFDEQQIGIQLEGLLHLPDMEFLEIRADDHRWQAGRIRSNHTIEETLSLTQLHRGEEIPIGSLRMIFSLDAIYSRLLHKIVIILITNGVKTFLVSGFILIIFQLLVTRHLTTLAGWARRFSLDAPSPPLQLDRKRPQGRRPDELDQLVAAINQMQSQLQSSIASLRESEAKYRLLTDNIPHKIFTKDQNLVYQACNDNFARDFGMSAAEIAGKTDFDLFPDRLARKYRADDRQILGSNTTETFEEEYLTTGGKKGFIQTIKTPVRDDNGEAAGIQGIFMDITERKKAAEEKALLEQQLRRSQKMEAIGTLAGGIAHDFNNILAAILGFADLAKEEAGENEPVRQDLEEVIQAALRAKELVRQILLFSRRSEQERHPLQAGLVIKEGLRLIEATLPATIEIRTHMTPRCPRMLADPTQIHQVLMNLCTNAAHAMEDEGGVLEVSLDPYEPDAKDLAADSRWQQRTYLRLRITDTGKGIGEDIMDKIFDPYFTTKEIGKGSGMGLAVVQGIVDAHEGILKVWSTPGRGTTFTVFIPAAP